MKLLHGLLVARSTLCECGAHTLGELVLDGSFHDWSEGRAGHRSCLMSMVAGGTSTTLLSFGGGDDVGGGGRASRVAGATSALAGGTSSGTVTPHS